MRVNWIIEKKRDGVELSAEEIHFLIDGYTREKIPDYQMAALCMAIYFQGMNFTETSVLTEAMMNSGRVLSHADIAKPKVDKHSTGGIGDKTSLVLAPLVACFDVAVPMISGRGLGITGGTLDKLESIPGFRVDLSEAEFKSVLSKCGVAMIGQTKDIAPADKKLYALRDVTATVPSIPLITSSIMSKKLAEGIDALVLDVKFGCGAFMKDFDQARELAGFLVEVGKNMGKQVRALLTDMNQPLGRAVGNAVEVEECLQILSGEGEQQLKELCILLSAHMLELAGVADHVDEIIPELERKLESGEAYQRFEQMVELQGGSLSEFKKSYSHPKVFQLSSAQCGFISAVDAEKVGRAAILLGAGRETAADSVDHAVGVVELKKVAESVEQGEALCQIVYRDQDRLESARELLQQAFTVGQLKSSPESILRDVLK